MQSLLKLISQAAAEAGISNTAAESFWDPLSIALFTVGSGILVIWLLWYNGLKALRHTPIRRHHFLLPIWSLAILFGWFIFMLSVTAAALAVSSREPTQEILTYILNAIVEILFIAGILILASQLFAQRLKGFGITIRHITHHIRWGFVNLLAVFPLMLLALWITLTLGRLLKGQQFELETHESLSVLSDAGFGLQLMVILFAVVIVPIFEELLFRGFFQTSLSSLSSKPWSGIILASFFFAILHPLTHFPALFVFSCGLGYAYERSGSLWRPILMHIFFNGLNVGMTLLVAN